HSTCTRLPVRPRTMAAEPGKLLPRLSTIRRTKEGGIFNAGIDGVRIGQRWLQMPDALELPGMRRAIVPLVCGEGLARFRRGVVNKFVALTLGHAFGRPGWFAGRCSGLKPGLAAVIRALNDLAEPAA